MKKIFLLLLLVVTSLIIFSTGEIMVMDIITHWENNGIGYVNSEDLISAKVTDNKEVLLFIDKNTNIVMFMFNIDMYSESVMNEFILTNRIPFNISTRKDILELLTKKINFYLVFEKLPKDTEGFLGNEYYIQSGFNVNDTYAILLIKDLG